MKSKGRRLSEKKWEEIRENIQSGCANMQGMSRKYKVSRNAIYSMAWRRGWIKKKESLFSKFLGRIWKK